jgi:hypothetical protein
MIVDIAAASRGRDGHGRIPGPAGLLFAQGERSRLASPLAGPGAGAVQVAGE